MSYTSNKKTSCVQRLMRKLAIVLSVFGMGLGMTLDQASAQQPTPVPQHWISYAQMASNQFEAWLSDAEDPAVQRLHGWMQERLLTEGKPLPTSLVVRVWLEPNGKVGRVEFDPLGKPEADEDLRGIMMSRFLSEPPPPDMRLPMVLQLSMELPKNS